MVQKFTSKAYGMKKALKHVDVDAYRTLHSFPHSEIPNDIPEGLKSAHLIREGGALDHCEAQKIGAITFEFLVFNYRGIMTQVMIICCMSKMMSFKTTLKSFPILTTCL